MPDNHHITSFEKKLLRQIAAQQRAVSALLDEFTRSITPMLTRYQKPPVLTDVWIMNKDIESAIDLELRKLQKSMKDYINSQTGNAWNLSAEKTDLIVNDYIKNLSISDIAKDGLFVRNLDALKEFQTRTVNGMDLSDRVWKVCQESKDQLELYMQSGLGSGRSAADISRDVRSYLKNPDARFRRVRDPETGKLVMSRPMAGYHPGQGVYRSAFKNALRMTRTETNMAYRASDMERWKKIDFIKGYEVKLSNNHPKLDICDYLKGEYPKTFFFDSWHPNCYHEDTEVYTVNGWKLFKDVTLSDRILTLNPETKEIQYAGVVNKTEYNFNGELIHFHNRSLDLKVTPDHRMVYLNKSNGKVSDDKKAIDFTKNSGALYRSCEWRGDYYSTIVIGKYNIDISVFSEFLGYFLSEGCCSRKYAIQIGQKEGVNDVKRLVIKACLDKLPFKNSVRKWGFELYDKSFYEYFKQFGKSWEKFVPDVIKYSDKDVISIFLNAYILGDGSVRKPKSFTGNRGTKFEGVNDEREYFTSSKKMADDLGELILKLGKRPSFKTQDYRGENKFKNGTYTVKRVVYRIRECLGKTATVFEKDTIPYNGMVYDIEVDKNHTLYVRLNGKCVWSSNCYCYCVPILPSQEDFVNYLNTDKLPGGSIKGIPPAAAKYIKDKSAAFARMKNKPSWLAGNFSQRNGIYYPKAGVDKPPVISGVIKENPISEKITAQQLEFIPAKSIKEAEEWALKNLNVKFADFKGLDLEVVNDINRSVYNIKKVMPETKTWGIGNAQRANKAMRSEIFEEVKKSEYFVNLTKIWGKERSEKWALSYARQKVSKVGSNTLAWSTNTESIYIYGGGNFDVSKYKGVFVNEKYGKSAALVNKTVIDNEKVGWYTKEAKDFSYIMSHEIGHEIDKTIGFRNTDIFKAIYSREHAKGIESVIKNLSKYGATAGGRVSSKPAEFIAEAWAEFITSPSPRYIAKEIGEAMLREYYNYYIHGTGTKFAEWKDEILKSIIR